MKVKLLLTFALLLTAVTGAWADDDSGSCGTVSYSYVESTHTLTISGTGAMADYDDPSERPWNNYVEEIETVIIEDGVTSIGSRAFHYCDGLTSVTIPASVTSIGVGVFYGCHGLTSVTIPASVTSIGYDAFRFCSSLTSVTIPASVTSIGVGVFADCSDLATMTVEADNTVYDSRDNCNAIIEKSTNTLIAGCKGTTIPTTVTSIGESSFIGCDGPTTITIPSSVTSIGNYAFENCSGLTTITIPASVTSIGNGAFAGCSNLATMTVDAGNTVYDSRNGCNAIIEKESNTLVVGCKGSTIPNDVTSIGEQAFSGCDGLTTVTIPASVTSIGSGAFEGCSGLTTVTIGSGVTYIGSDAFYNCTKVEVVYCNADPTKLTWEEDGCDDFKKDGSTIINVADADPWYTKFGGEVHGIFSDTPYVPLTWNYDAATKTLTFSGTAAIPSYNDPDDRPWKDYVSEVEKIVISDGVMSIGINAFEYCASLTTVTIPASVKSIGMSAFYDCTGLTTITIPASVTSIGRYAFYHCESLTSVIVHASNCTLGEDAFDECYKLEAIYVPSDKVEYYKAAENWSAYADKITAFIGGDCGAEGHEKDVTWVLKGTSLTISGTGAMADYASSENQPWKDYRSSITSVIIESGVTSIGENAFNNCTGLTSVTVDAPDCTLGNGALEGCSKLEAIYVPSDLVDHYKTAWSAYADKIMDVKEKIISQGYCGAEGHEEDVTWVLKGTSPNYTLTISGTGAMADYDDPFERPWDSYANGIETIVIEDGVTSIGSSAFYDCASLTTVTIPASVTSIGKYAFENCSGLTTITIPASVTSIGYGVFASCNQLETMMVEAGNKVYDSRNSCNAIIEKESNTLIAGCKNTIIPDDVTNIGNNAFEGCEGLTTVTIPAGVTYIGPDAFFYCTGITDVYCNADPTKLTWDEVGCDDFKEDGSTIIHVADADPWYTKFGGVVNGVFRDPSTIPLTWNYDSDTKTLSFSGKEPIPSYDLDERPWKDYVEEVENIIINEGVRGIGNQAFSGCSDLTTVTIPASVTSIGKYAFNYCSGLTTITIPAGVTRIGDHAFIGCSGLTTVTIPAGVTSIGGHAFEACSGLTTVTIGSGVTYIGYDAFFNCTAVTDVYCYADPDALTWEEGGCDDFMVGKATKCHVTDETKFKANWSTGDPEVDVNVDFVGDLAPQAKTKAAGAEYWSSYYNTIAHLKADDNTTVYKATLSGTTVTLTEINDKVITAGQAVLLKKTTNDPVVLTPCADSSEDDYSDNDLEGVDAKTAKESGFDYYVLSYQDSKLSFYKYSGTTLGANKAFFKIPANSSREFLDILGEVTGIDGLNGELKNGKIEELKFYDLNGRRVMNPTKKGVYINNGRKVVIK